MIPKTTTYRQFKEKKARDEAEAASAAQPGQTTLPNGVNGQVRVQSGDLAGRHEMTESHRIEQAFNTRPAAIANGSPIADRTVSSTPHAHPGAGDVEMQD